MEQIIQGFEQALLVMDREQARDVVESGTKGLEPVTFVETVMVPALERIGAGWETGAVSLSQVYMSGRICDSVCWL